MEESGGLFDLLVGWFLVSSNTKRPIESIRLLMWRGGRSAREVAVRAAVWCASRREGGATPVRVADDVLIPHSSLGGGRAGAPRVLLARSLDELMIDSRAARPSSLISFSLDD